MVMKADAPFEQFALNTSPSGLFWADWQNSHTLTEWRLVALVIFMKLGEGRAAHWTESKQDSNAAAHCDEEDDGELSDDTLRDSSHAVAPQVQAPCDSTSDPKCPILRTASGHISSSERGGRDGENENRQFWRPGGYQDDWDSYHDIDEFFRLQAGRMVCCWLEHAQRDRNSAEHML